LFPIESDQMVRSVHAGQYGKAAPLLLGEPEIRAYVAKPNFMTYPNDVTVTPPQSQLIVINRAELKVGDYPFSGGLLGEVPTRLYPADAGRRVIITVGDNPAYRQAGNTFVRNVLYDGVITSVIPSNIHVDLDANSLEATWGVGADVPPSQQIIVHPPVPEFVTDIISSMSGPYLNEYNAMPHLIVLGRRWEVSADTVRAEALTMRTRSGVAIQLDDRGLTIEKELRNDGLLRTQGVLDLPDPKVSTPRLEADEISANTVDAQHLIIDGNLAPALVASAEDLNVLLTAVKDLLYVLNGLYDPLDPPPGGDSVDEAEFAARMTELNRAVHNLPEKF